MGIGSARILATIAVVVGLATAVLLYERSELSFESPTGIHFAQAAIDTSTSPVAAPPANDDFDDAIEVATLPFTDSQNVEAATLASDDPPTACANSYDQSVWYRFTAATSGAVRVDTLGSDYDTVLALYTGSRGALSEAACNDQFIGNQSLLTFEAVASTTYYVMVANRQTTPGSSLAFHMQEIGPPTNDDFDSATEVPSLPFANSVQTTIATRAADDPPTVCAGSYDRSVWYRFTPSEETHVMVDTFESSYDTVLAVYTGARGSLAEVVCNDDFASHLAFTSIRSAVAWQALPDTTYHIMVASYGSAAANDLVIRLDVVEVSPIPPETSALDDPEVDILPGAPSKPDVVSVAWSLDTDNFFLTVEFREPIDVHSHEGKPVGYIDFDTDGDSATGWPSLVDWVCPDPSSLGVERRLSLYSISQGIAGLTPGPVVVPIAFDETSFTVRIPHTLLGGGAFNLAMVLGSPDGLTDCVPNGCCISVGGDMDSDGDHICDLCDNCPTVSNENQANSDTDSHGDACDNCPLVDNEAQIDSDTDSHGDACDNCLAVSNENQANSDTDSHGDACDNCPLVDNEAQIDSDTDSHGDACDNCLAVSNENQANSDTDSHGDACDNCPNVGNEDQADSDADGVGDACELPPPRPPTPTPTATATPGPTPIAMASVSIPMVAGWNDKCYVGEQKSIEEALGGIADKVLAVYVLNQAQGFDRWFPGRADVSTIATFNPYDQLFILMSGAAGWTQEFSTEPNTATLVQGWNSVCYAGQTKPVDQATAGISGGFAILYVLTEGQTWAGYVPNRPDISSISELKTYESVLVLVTQPGGTTWVFDP